MNYIHRLDTTALKMIDNGQHFAKNIICNADREFPVLFNKNKRKKEISRPFRVADCFGILGLCKAKSMSGCDAPN